MHFPAEESEVIGFGGDELYPSDSEDIIEPEENGLTCDDDVDVEEDRALQRLTRTNTDFNSLVENLSGSGNSETKRTYTQLLLGKPLTDAEGRRKTLQVSVTPFGGQDESSVPTLTSIKKNILGKHQDTTKIITQSSFGKNSEIPNEKSGEIVLKSVIKNTGSKQENTSSLGMTNGENSLKETDISMKKSFVKKNGLPHQNSREIILKSLLKSNGTSQIPGDTDAGTRDERNAVDIAHPQDFKYKTKDAPSNKAASEVSLKLSVRNITQISREIGENISKANENETSEGKVSRIPVIKSRVSPEKFKVVSRTSAFSGRYDLLSKPKGTLPKPAVRKSSYESLRKIENTIKDDGTNLVTSEAICKDSGQSHQNEDCSNHRLKKDSGVCPEAIISSSVSQSEAKLVKGLEILANRGDFSTDTPSKLCSVTGVDDGMKQCDTSSNTAVVESKDVNPTADEIETFVNCIGDLDKEAVGISCNIESTSKEIRVGCPMSPVNEETRKLSGEIVTEDEIETLRVRKIEGESLVTNPVNVTVRAEDVIEEVLLKEKDVEMFCAEESRELAGEPDGRADPDELNEPPALPRSPPPVIDPRPSFLHALTQVNTLRKGPGDKPKIPVKPSTKVLQAAPRRHVLPQSPKQTQEGHHDAFTQIQEHVLEVKLSLLPVLPLFTDTN